jgi:hypothetical protein
LILEKEGEVPDHAIQQSLGRQVIQRHEFEVLGLVVQQKIDAERSQRQDKFSTAGTLKT